MKLTIELTRATDLTAETWVSHCLELDAISQGETPRMAIEALAEAVDMMVSDEIAKFESSGQTEKPGWERAFGNIADEIARRDAAPASNPATIDHVYLLAKEFVERLERLGLAGAIVMRDKFANGCSYELRGKSTAWVARGETLVAAAENGAQNP